jgi:Cu/Ag efflux protein CusF
MKHGTLSSAVALLLSLAAANTQAASPWLSPAKSSAASALWLVHEGHAGAAHASGVVNTVDVAQRKINVSHGSIKQLGWPAMTMDFPVGGDVDLTGINPGMKVNFTLVKGSGGAWTVDTLKASPKQ